MSAPSTPGRPRPAFPIIREPAAEPWGLTEMWIEDPDGIRIVLAEVPADTLSAVTHDRRHRQGDEPYAA